MTAVVMMAVMEMRCLPAAAAESLPDDQTDARSPALDPYLLALPPRVGPVVVHARFDLHDINEINEEAETFEFAGVLTLRWKDSRLAFDPAAEGASEKVYQGNYQFNEVATGWYPQVVLVNESGLFASNGVLLRIQPDGTSILTQTINATAEVDLNMRRFPFDDHRLEARFEVLGFDADEVQFQVEHDSAGLPSRAVRVPQWDVRGFSTSVEDRPAPYAGRRGVASTLIVGAEVHRDSFYISRLIVLPLVIIVLLSFSVFWMDRSSLGDRISVSFIGILTGVAYQIVMSDKLPEISYVTLMHGFLNLSFLTMCATVVINLVVGALDKGGKQEAGDRIDRRCRWVFPLTYFGFILVMVAVAFLFF